jgi:FMN phosphatase YigB (HAD superfamily)
VRQVARRWRAVVFDLWGTLIELPTELFAERDEAIAAALGG